MLLCINIGNSDILMGAYRENNLMFSYRAHTEYKKSANEYALELLSLLNFKGFTKEDIDDIIIACVVPSLLPVFKNVIAEAFSKPLVIIGPGLKTGINIKTDNPAQVGSDLVCAAAFAISKYQPPCLLISFDTAISFVAIDAKGVLKGCAIAPGLEISMNALCSAAAQLTEVDYSCVPQSVVGTNTAASLQSGFVYGFASMLDGMIERFIGFFSAQPKIIATGENSCHIIKHCRYGIIYEENLILRGMKIIYDKNKL